MGTMYTAEEDEAEVARATFGKRVATIVFYDPDFPGEPWTAHAFDSRDNPIGIRRSSAADLVQVDGENIFSAVAARGETVKFWLVIEQLECEGHESLDGAHMGESVYCDGSCRRWG